MIRRTVVSPTGTLYTVTGFVEPTTANGETWLAWTTMGWSDPDGAGSIVSPATAHATEADAIAWATAEVDRRCGSYPDA